MIKADLSSYKPPPYRVFVLILNSSLSTHYSGWISCLISFVWSSPSCNQRDISEIFKMIKYASAGNRTSDPLLSSVSISPLGYRGCWQPVNKTFSVLIYATILQELCVVYKGIYRKRKINQYLLTVSWLIRFKYEMIYTKEEIYYVLYANDYISRLTYYVIGSDNGSTFIANTFPLRGKSSLNGFTSTPPCARCGQT